MRKCITISAIWLMSALLFYMASPSFFAQLFLGSSLLLCGLLSMYIRVMKKHIHVSLHTVSEGIAQHPHEYVVTVQNNSWLPIMRLRAVVNMQHAITGDVLTHPLTISVAPRKKATLTCRLVLHVVGKYDASLQACTVYDAFGLFYTTLTQNSAQSVMMMPNAYTQQIQPLHAFTIAASAQQLMQGEDITEIRAYTAGDEMKHIHWKLSSKLDELHVKKLEQPMMQELLVTADFTSFTKSASQYDGVMTTMYALCASTISAGNVVKLAVYDNSWHMYTLEQHDQIASAFYHVLAVSIEALTLQSDKAQQLLQHGAACIVTTDMAKQSQQGYVFIPENVNEKLGEAA